MTGICVASGSGVTSASGSSSRSSTTRCALYDSSSSTRHAGRQSSSQQQTMRSGSRSVTSRVMKSSSPRTALTGVPSGAVIESGTPKKARKYSEAVSSSINLGPGVMGASVDQAGSWSITSSKAACNSSSLSAPKVGKMDVRSRIVESGKINGLKARSGSIRSIACCAPSTGQM